MVQLRLPIRVLARPADDEDACGEYLASLVREALGRGSKGAVAVVVRSQRTELIELRAIVEARIQLAQFLAGLTRSDAQSFGSPLAVGLAGRFTLRRGAQRSPIALAFLEWPDCRWWQWTTLIDGANQLVVDSEVRHRAIDGDPLPAGLGRWWTLGRRTRTTVHYDSTDRGEQSAPLVH